MTLLVCDKCGYHFGPDKIKLRNRTIDKDSSVIERYFRCPKCKAKYTVLVSNPEIRRLIFNHMKDAALNAERKLRSQYADKLN